MKSALGPFLFAIVLALAGGALWLAGHTETRLADVHKQMALLRYAMVLDAGRGGAPEDVVLGDRTLQVMGLIWVGLFAAGVYAA